MPTALVAEDDLGSDEEATAWARKLIRTGLSVGRLSREITAGFVVDVPLDLRGQNANDNRPTRLSGKRRSALSETAHTLDNDWVQPTERGYTLLCGLLQQSVPFGAQIVGKTGRRLGLSPLQYQGNYAR